jgi:hypothetical protein
MEDWSLCAADDPRTVLSSASATDGTRAARVPSHVFRRNEKKGGRKFRASAYVAGRCAAVRFTENRRITCWKCNTGARRFLVPDGPDGDATRSGTTVAV